MSLQLTFTVLLSVAAVLGFSSCATPKSPVYPPLVLDLAGTESSAQATLHTVIVPGGADALTKDARWDEYVLTFTNRGGAPLSLETVVIEDTLGNQQLPSGDLHKLTERTVENWKAYRKAKVPVSKEKFESRIPTAVAVPLEGAWSIIYPLELIFLTVDLTRDSKHQTTLQEEITQRQLVFPLLLQPGSSALGSVFFPMTAGPRQLVVKAQCESGPIELVIPLTALSRLHLVTAPSSARN